jgi:cadmium resistance protein CadD (predicted permease)
MFGLLGVAIALFASTNIDDIFVLVGFFANPRFRAREIVTGQYLGIAALVGVSIAASLSSALLPLPYLGFLAIVPIALGTKSLFEIYRGRAEDKTATAPPLRGRGHSRTATVALITIVNGGDNIGIYTPAFAVHSRRELAVIVLVFTAMTAAWCLFALWVVSHPRLGKPIRRYGKIGAPLVLIALGVTVMFQAGTLGLMRHAL